MTHSQDICADVLIITVTPVESRAVLQAFEQATGEKAKSITVEKRTYRDLGTIKGSKVFMAFSRMGSIGLGASQQAVQKSIEALNPQAVIMVGIAFGMNEEKQAIGDILVSEQLMLYESQRISMGEIVSRGSKVPCATSLYNYLYNAHLDWIDAEVSFGLMLTGEKLVDNVDYRKSLKKLEAEAIGGEMEGAGLYTACQEEKVDWILVKAICDWADGNKNEDKKQRQQLAANNAVAFVLHALQHAELPRLPSKKNNQSQNNQLSTNVSNCTVNGHVVTAQQISDSFNKTEIHHHYPQQESKDEFSDNWFKSHIETSIADLSHRYTPELNFTLDIAKNFDALSRNNKFREHFRDEIHDFLKNFKKIDNEFLEKEAVKGFIDLLNNQFNLVQDTNLLTIDIDSIQRNTKLVRSELYEYKKYVASKESELTKDSFNYKTHNINKAGEALYLFEDFINSPALILTNKPMMLLSGEAGIGKSHLLGDIARIRINENKACILLLGQKFTSEESPWTQILNNLLRVKCNEHELLEALNAKAEAQGERLLFMIDAINEGKGRYFWTDYIKGFIKDFSNYPWLGLVLSIRTSYEPELTPKELITDADIIRITHYGFENVEYQASSFFFSEYGIEQPNIPLLHPEFSNPLFLKLFCDGLKKSGYKTIPKGYGGITSIMNFFLESINKKLSHQKYFKYPINKNIVKIVINKLVEYKLKNNATYFIPYDDAFDIADCSLSKFSSERGFLEALISEGVLSKNIYWKNDDSEEGIYFAYERFEDHLTVAYLLEKYLDNDNPEVAFQDNNVLAKYITHGYQYQGIVEALSIQLPEKIDKELYEVIPENKKSEIAIAEAFIKSLIWRNPQTIKEKTKDFVNQHILDKDHTFDLFFQMIYSVSSDSEHFYNADGLHRYLMQFSLADRDAIWTTYLHDKNYQGSAMQRLIDWVLQEEDKSYLSDESRLLACKALAWLFTSTNNSFRDSATKALVCLLENQLPIVCRLLVDTHNINDPYVQERVFAAAYGAVLRSNNLEGLEKLATLIYETRFCIKNILNEEVYPNVLVRDYARNIIEYALYKKVSNLANLEIIRPPYNSKFPDSFPSNKEINAYKYDYEAKDFKDYYWGQNIILSSMGTEHGRSPYGDFGRYTFEAELHGWSYKFDANDLSNYACKLIFEKYGYDVEKHGRFDRHTIQYNSRSSPIKERIGKKYQWLALYEVLARVSDNYPMSEGYGDNKEYFWYEGTFEPFVRNIDPTVIYRKNEKKTDKNQETWWNKVEYNDWSDTHQNWLISSEKLPNPKEIIELKDTQGNEWLALKTHFTWNEPVPIGYEQYDYPHKHLWYQIRSYFVHNDEADTLIAWAKKQHFMGKRWFPENHDEYQVFSREYYWSPAYRFFDDHYYGRSQWEEVYENNSNEDAIAKVMVTTESHIWESGASDEERPSYLAPRELMYEKMQLQYSKNIGEWLNAQGEVVCFDPSVNQDTSSYLLVRKDALLKFLDENNLKIFWTCLGEKRIHGDFYHETKISEWLELSGVFTLSSDCVEGDITLHPQSAR